MASRLTRICWRFSTTKGSSFARILTFNASPASISYTECIENEINRKFSDSLHGVDNKDSEIPLKPRKTVEEITRIKPKQFAISFEEYMKLKSNVRTKQRVSGLPFAVLGLGTSSVVSAYMFPEMFDATPENVQLIMGLDPLVFCGICGVVSAGLGYAMGTQLFKSLWRVLNKEKSTMLLEREKDFLERIQRNRFASFSKFEDDYYGENIKNLSDYRQWCRTQQKKAAADEKFVQENKDKNEGHEARTV